MPLTISDSRSYTIEPLRKNRWVLQFASIPGASNGDEATELAFVAHTSNAPTLTMTPVEYNRLNEKFYTAGRPVWNDLSMSFYDFIRSGANKSAGDIIYSWTNKIYNPLTGQMGYKSQYTTSATLAQLDPEGTVIRAWNLFHVWPSTTNFGDGLSADDDGLLDIQVTFKYDIAIKITDQVDSRSQ